MDIKNIKLKYEISNIDTLIHKKMLYTLTKRTMGLKGTAESNQK